MHALDACQHFMLAVLNNSIVYLQVINVNLNLKKKST